MSHAALLRVLSWNLQDGGRDKAEAWLERRLASGKGAKPDFILFQEYNVPPSHDNPRKELTSCMKHAGYRLVHTLHVSKNLKKTQFRRLLAVYALEAGTWTWTTVLTDSFIGYTRGDIQHGTSSLSCRLVPTLLHNSSSEKLLLAMLEELERTSSTRNIVMGDFNFDRIFWQRLVPLLDPIKQAWLPPLSPVLAASSYPPNQLLLQHNLPVTYKNGDDLGWIDYVLIQPNSGLKLTELRHYLDAEDSSNHFPIEAVIEVT